LIEFLLDLDIIMSVALSSSDAEVIERAVLIKENEYAKAGASDLAKIFEVSKCAAWIRERRVSRVALQFPDALLKHAPIVAKLIREQLQLDNTER